MSDWVIGPICNLLRAMVKRAEQDARGRCLGRNPDEDPEQIRREAADWLRELRGVNLDEL